MGRDVVKADLADDAPTSIFDAARGGKGEGGDGGGGSPLKSQTPLETKYDFSRGHPNRNLVPVQEMKEIMAELSSLTLTTTRTTEETIDEDKDDEMVSAMGYLPEEGSDDTLAELRGFLKRWTATDNDGRGENKKDNVGQSNDDGDETDENDNNVLFMTNGVSHGVELLCRTHTRPGDVVLVERPTYFLASDIFRCNGLVVRGLPMKMNSGHGGGQGKGEGEGRALGKDADDDGDNDDENDDDDVGVDVNRLIQLVEKDMALPAPRMIYVIPTNQNPTGYTMPASDRRKLASFAERNGILVVADEVYHLLDWRDDDDDDNDVDDANAKNDKAGGGSSSAIAAAGGRLSRRRSARRRPARMATFNSGNMRIPENDSGSNNNNNNNNNNAGQIGGCVSVSAFTKIFAPGVRCGWIEGPKQILQPLRTYGYVRSQGGFAPFMNDMIMRHALRSGRCDLVLDRLRHAYKRRCRRLCDALDGKKEAGEGNRKVKVKGVGEEQKEEKENEIQTTVTVRRPMGGYFIWVRFPHGVDAAHFLNFCKHGASDFASGVRFRPGTMCDGLFGNLARKEKEEEEDDDDNNNDNDNEELRTNDAISGVSVDALRPYARLCFADLDEEDLYIGARRLLLALDEYITTMGCASSSNACDP